MKNQILSVVMSSVMMFAFAAPAVMADADKYMEEVLVSVKERVEIPEECTEFEINSSKHNGKTVYTFSWSTPSDAEESKYVSVACDSDKLISRYDYSDFLPKTVYSSDSGLHFSKYSSEEIKEIAQNFSDKINPQIKDEVKVSDAEMGIYGTRSGFGISRVENGAEVIRNTGSLNVDTETGSVTSYYINWDDVDEFPAIDNAITEDSAKTAFKDKLGMELVYDSYVDKDKLVFYPKYRTVENNKYINALTGEVYEKETDDIILYEKDENGVEAYAAAADGGYSDMLSESEVAELEKMSGLVSKLGAEKLVRDNKLFDISADMEMQYISLGRKSSCEKDEYEYSMSFSDGEHFVGVSINAKNGETLSYYCSDVKPLDEKEDDAEISRETADSIMNTLTPSVAADFEYTENGQYVRKANGIKVVSDTARVEVDADGKLVSYYVNYTSNTEFPPVAGAMSAAEAADRLFEQTDYRIVYMLDKNEDEKYFATPVYMMKDDFSINPFTGNAVDYRNENVEKEIPMVYSDIENHYAKAQIEKLAEYNIGFNSSEFKPDEKITLGDFVEFISKALPYHENIAYGEKNENVTREKAAVMLIKALGAEEYAKYEDIYVKPFNDVEEYKGYIALLSAMGIVEGDDDGNFNPKNLLSRAETAIILYNYLSR